jgi:hypothetical protein
MSSPVIPASHEPGRYRALGGHGGSIAQVAWYGSAVTSWTVSRRYIRAGHGSSGLGGRHGCAGGTRR